jgi:dTDP-4-amino-4,6-dideoxygalactose transaminase
MAGDGDQQRVAVLQRPRQNVVDESLTMDVTTLPEHSVAAVLAVHPYGAACDVATVGDWARRHAVVVVEDVAQALGGSFQGQPLGRFGVAAAFSFQASKLLSTGEGGMVVSSDPELAARIEVLHDAAGDWTVPATASRVPTVRRPPTNLRMSEIEGAFGLVQLSRVADSVAQLRAIQSELLTVVRDVDGVRVRPTPDAAGDVGTSVIFHLDTAAEAGWVVHALEAEGVLAAPLLGWKRRQSALGWLVQCICP